MEKIASRLLETTRMRLNGQITPGGYLSDLLSRIALAAGKTIGSQRCSLFLSESDTGKLVLRATNAMDPLYRKIRYLPQNASTESRAVVCRKPIFVSDLQNDPDCSYKDIASSLNLESLVCIPLNTGDKIFGVVDFYTKLSREAVSGGIEPLTRFVYKAASMMRDMALLGLN